MSLSSDAEDFKRSVRAFHSHHANKTFYPGKPGIEPWLRDTLVALQNSLDNLAELELKMAQQIDTNTANILRIADHVNRQN